MIKVPSVSELLILVVSGITGTVGYVDRGICIRMFRASADFR